MMFTTVYFYDENKAQNIVTLEKLVNNNKP